MTPLHRSRLLAGLSGAAALSVAATMLVVGATPAAAAAGCRVDYSINQWDSGFTASVTVTNLGDPIASGWTVEWDFAGSQRVEQQGWNAVVVQTGQRVAARNPAWSSTLGAGASAGFGFNATWSGTNTVPGAFTLNGVACTGVQPPGPTTTTPTPTTTTTAPPVTTSPPAPGTHVANPYAGAAGYVNPDWSGRVRTAAQDRGGALGAQMERVAGVSTAVWLDRIAAIAGTAEQRGLRGHLDAALAQRTGTTPVVVQVVVYDLPNRDCAALASNGELLVAQNGLARYRAEYIDPIAAVLADPKYASLRIVTIVEPDSLPNLVTNLATPKCAEAQSSGAYVQGIQYALNRLHAIDNVYTYLDIAHSAWLGWDSNFGPAVNLITQTIRGTTAGVRSVDGFISNTANYTPTGEPNLPDQNLNVGGQPLRSAGFYGWNPYFDEADYGIAMYQAFVAAGLPGDIGMLVDTSRNGWGGSARPSAATGSTVEGWVNSGRVDRRLHRGNWCNQSGAGLGTRPQVAPLPSVDAFVWVKPPGESDGASSVIPNDEGKGFDRMCDPTYTGTQQANGQNLTGALPDSPLAGKWFDAQFVQLVENAYPPL